MKRWNREHVAKLIRIRRERPLIPLATRFWKYVMPEPNSGCWLWTGATVRGYGYIGRGRVVEGNVLAHRLAYEMLRGPIPAGVEPDHLCRVRSCVNPGHIELVTRRINFLRGVHPNAIAHLRKLA